MKVLKPTRWQRLMASNVLPLGWAYLLVPAAAVACSFYAVGTLRFVLSDLWSAGLLLVIVLLSYLIGVGIGTFTCFFVFGPILYHQGLLNGGPFQKGDVVQVISGPHRDRGGRIYSGWQHDTYRVDLDEESRENYSDIFADYQLLRVESEFVDSVENTRLT